MDIVSRTLNPKNPQPQALDPKPQTLNPKLSKPTWEIPYIRKSLVGLAWCELFFWLDPPVYGLGFRV